MEKFIFNFRGKGSKLVEVTIEKNLSYCQFKELIPDLVSIYQRAYENLPEYRDDSYCKKMCIRDRMIPASDELDQ